MNISKKRNKLIFQSFILKLPDPLTQAAGRYVAN